MNIEFDNPKHEKLANDYDALCKRYNKKGSDSADNILEALDILKATESLAEVPRVFRPHPLKGTYKGYFAINVDDVHRVIFKPDHEDDENFRIDNYKSIKNILIIEIFKDYH